MIHFEITDSPDLNVKTDFKFHRNQVYLGRRADDLCIVDPGLRDSHLLIEVPEKDLLIHPQRDVEFYLLNGKRSTSIRRAKVGDVITIGNTSIKILGYQHEEVSTKKDVLKQKLDQLLEANSPRLGVIEKITELMK